jgi:hypothetical protein
MTAEEIKDYKGRAQKSSSVTVRKPMPKFADTINIRRPEDRAAWESMDKKLKEWLKTLNGA